MDDFRGAPRPVRGQPLPGGRHLRASFLELDRASPGRSLSLSLGMPISPQFKPDAPGLLPVSALLARARQGEGPPLSAPHGPDRDRRGRSRETRRAFGRTCFRGAPACGLRLCEGSRRPRNAPARGIPGRRAFSWATGATGLRTARAAGAGDDADFRVARLCRTRRRRARGVEREGRTAARTDRQERKRGALFASQPSPAARAQRDDRALSGSRVRRTARAPGAVAAQGNRVPGLPRVEFRRYCPGVSALPGTAGESAGLSQEGPRVTAGPERGALRSAARRRPARAPRVLSGNGRHGSRVRRAFLWIRGSSGVGLSDDADFRVSRSDSSRSQTRSGPVRRLRPIGRSRPWRTARTTVAGRPRNPARVAIRRAPRAPGGRSRPPVESASPDR